jgi:AraC-like DNA-binding protein
LIYPAFLTRIVSGKVTKTRKHQIVLFVGNHSTLYVGPLQNRQYVSHKACCLLYAPQGVSLHVPDQPPRHSTLWLIPGQFRHQLMACPEARCLFIEPDHWFSRGHSALLNLSLQLDPPPAERTALLRCLMQTPLPTAAAMGAQIETLLATGPLYIDPRLARVLQFIKANLTEPVTLDTLAAVANLSVGRLQHLMKQQVGMPVTNYIHWQRIKRAAECAEAGRSLTAAAHEAGFADAAHFSRLFARMFGIAPSQLW